MFTYPPKSYFKPFKPSYLFGLKHIEATQII
jgi:hypothetical protein